MKLLRKSFGIVLLIFVSLFLWAQNPTPVVVTDKNGNQLAITNSTTGTQVGAPTPVVLTDKNGNALVLQAGGASSTVTIASGTAALGTGSISSGACATAVTSAGAGIATTDNILADFNGDSTGVTGYAPSASGMLTIIKYPTAGNVNFKVCNNTAGSITPGAITLNWRVVR
jgi:hypothetical protein